MNDTAQETTVAMAVLVEHEHMAIPVMGKQQKKPYHSD